MASTSRQTSLFGLQNWQKIYQPYSNADLQSYDYETLRKNFIDYLTKNYPETFNDYVESSEFVALLDVIAYMGQALAFRGDLNARENFLDTAQRRDSVIKLANLVSYNPKRNTAGKGMVKVTAISTTENIVDINGINLSNSVIQWNDPANSSWQEQFNAVLNAALINNQRIGKPGNSQSILDIKTDEYTINLPLNTNPVVKFQAEIDATVMNFELVSVTSLNQSYLYELPPAPAGQFNMLYRNDKLGYGSPNTGFFLYFKQGSLQSTDFNFAEKVENNVQPVNVQGINNEDTWLYKLDDSGQISQLWTQVENVYINSNNTQGTSVKNIFSVASRANDEITYVFSDGVFGTIPVGLFRAYYRSSNALQYTIDPSEMSGLTASLEYVSRSGRTETLTFTFSLQTPSSTAQNRESLDSIKERAPSRYYSQNRMVNGEDYSNFPFTLYNSIIKSKAVNRTSVGVSRNLDLLDPSAKYSSTNVFADDGALTFNNTSYTTTFSTTSSAYAAEFLSSALPSLLSSSSSIQYYQTYYDRKDSGVSDSLAWRWHLSGVTGSQVTGYFYQSTTGTEVPVPVGAFSTTNLKYVSSGAQIKFVSADTTRPYFDANNRLTATNTGVTSIWIGVDAVIGDGYNYGSGNLSSGIGPITLSDYVPNGVKIASVNSIIPEFDNTLSSTIIAQAQAKIRLEQDFALQFDDTRIASSERWSVIDIPSTDTSNNYFVKFVHNSTDNLYTVSIRSVNYYFSSISDVRFTYDSSSRVYDPKTGKVVSDTVGVLQTTNINTPYQLNVVGQPIQSNGFADDFQVIVSPINQTTGYSNNPEAFELITGSATQPVISPSTAVFFNTTVDSDKIETVQLLAPGTVIYNNLLTSLDSINDVKYEYEAGTIFYCENAVTVTLTAYSTPGSATAYKVEAVTALPHNLTVGKSYDITISGSSTADNIKPYYGTFAVTVISETEFTYQIASSVAPINTTATVVNRFYESYQNSDQLPIVLLFRDVTSSYSVKPGKAGLRFQYKHNSGQTNRIDPATTNIIDLFVVTQSYYTSYMNWLSDTTGTISQPTMPTISELRQSYGELNSYKMISDSVVLNSASFKPLFGTKASKNLQGTIKVVKNAGTTASDSQVRSSVLSAMNTYFSLDNWTFGDTFFFSELTAYLHVQLGSLISSVILVPADPSQKFGDMYEIRCQPNEIFCNGATANDIVVVSALTAGNMNR